MKKGLPHETLTEDLNIAEVHLRLIESSVRRGSKENTKTNREESIIPMRKKYHSVCYYIYGNHYGLIIKVEAF